MGRISMITDEQAAQSKVVTELFESSRELIGRVPYAQRTYAHFPYAAVWQLPFGSTLQRQGGGGKLDGRTKQLVVLSTSVTNLCEYCTVHNTALAQSTGLTLPEIDAVLEGTYHDSPVLDDRDKAVVRWAEAVTKNEAARDAKAFAALTAWFDEAEIVEMTWLCGLFNMFNRVHEALQIDVEPQAEVDLIKRSATLSPVAVARYAKRVAEAIIEAEGEEP